MGDTLYIQTDMNVEVHHPRVYLQNVAKLSGNPQAVNQCRVIPILDLSNRNPGRYVTSVIDIIRKLQQKNPNLEITHIGEPTFIITYEREKRRTRFFHWVKTGFICLVSFFGTAFSIMTFDTDVDIPKLFSLIYEQMTGRQTTGFGVLEITYSIGIGLGVLFFFNHFTRRGLTQDPTPMQVQMRVYEDNVNTTIIEDLEREKEQACGDK